MRRILFVMCIIFLLLGMVLPIHAARKENRVLFISSYHPGFPTFFQQIDGIKSVLNPAGVKFDVEFMDSKRFFTPDNISAFHDLLKLKLKLQGSDPYDVIITSDDNALEFTLKFHDELFKNIPVVFCGVNNQKLARSMNSNDLFTGVIEEVSMKETLDLIFRLFPQVGKVYAIVDRTPSGQGDFELYKEQRNKFFDKKLDIMPVSSLSWDELGRKLEGLTDNDAVLLLSAYQDRWIEKKSFDESLEFIISHSKVPVFHLWEHGLGQGIIGGKVISHFEQGAVAASIAVDIINGIDPKDIDVLEGHYANKFSFDYSVLKGFNIKKGELPAGSFMINEPSSILHHYSKEIKFAVVFMVLMLVLSVVLLVYVLRLRVAEDRIRKSEERFALAMEANRDGLWDWEIDTDTVYYSPGYKAMLGYKVDEVPSHVNSWMDLIHPADVDAALKANMDCIENITESFEVEFRMQAKNGQWRWILGRGKAVERNGAGRAIRVVGTHTDITNHKQVEEDLRRLQGYLTNIIDSMPSVLIGLDGKGLVTLWNREAQRVTGLNSSNAEGKILSEVFPRLSSQMEGIENSLKNKEVYSNARIWSHEKGKEKYENITVYPLSLNGDNGAVIRVDDVTERVRLEEIVVQSEKMLSVGSLAAGMAHEINNPLGAVIQGCQNVIRRLSMDLSANYEIAKNWGVDFDSLQGYLKEREIFQILEGVSSSGMRAAAIVSNMLSFSRKSGKSRDNHDISDLLEKTLDLAVNEYDFERKYDFRKIEIKREYGENVPGVCCEGNEIKQVFLNLLKNGAYAITEKKYVDDTPCITLKTSFEHEMVVVEIIDNGTGMDESSRKRVFEPFYTTKDVGQGTGLGLSVSYFIVTEQHHGEMEVFSSPGNWTRFVVRLPVKVSQT